MNKKEALDLYINLNSKVLNNLPGAKFAYTLHKNRELLKPEIESIDKANAYSEEFSKLIQEFEPTRIKIAESHTTKGNDGNPRKVKVEINGQETEIYEMTPIHQKESNEECDKALRALNLPLVEAREKQVTEYNNLLKEEVSTMQLHKIKLEDLPPNITGLQVEQLKELIRE